MNDKKYVTQTLAQVMCRHGISMADIKNALDKIPIKEQFDLAAQKENGKIIRVPLNEENLRLNVVGIYPFKDDERYLELSETDYKTAGKRALDNVPTLDDFHRFNTILIQLNETIEKIGGKPLLGWYHTVITYGGCKNFYPYYVVNVGLMDWEVDADFEPRTLKGKVREFVKT